MPDANPQADPGPRKGQVTERIPPCDVVVVFAMAVEAKGFVEKLSDVVSTHCHTFVERAGYLRRSRIVVVETGCGRTKAEQATEDAIAIHKPSWIVSAGFASGLNDNLQAHDIVMADRIVDTDRNHLSVGFKMDADVVRETEGLHVGTLLTVNDIICNPATKRDLGKKHDALACDTESMVVADACRQAKVRFMSVRVIRDTVDQQLSRDVQTLLRQDSVAGKLGAATGTLFRRPSSLKQLWKEKKQAQLTSGHLAKFLLGVIHQLVPGKHPKDTPKDR